MTRNEMTAVDEFNQAFGLSITAPSRATKLELILFANTGTKKTFRVTLTLINE